MSSEFVRDVETFFTVYLPNQFGYPVNENQISLAKDVCHVLLTGDEHSLFAEAETGTGKTLSYLVPALLYLSDNPERRIGVSTHSRSLQIQLSAEVARVQDYLTSLGKFVPRVASYLGKRAFINELATQSLLMELVTEKELSQHAYERCLMHLADVCADSGVIQDFLDRVEADGIQLTLDARLMSTESEGQYHNNLAKVETSQLVIFTHIALLSSAQYGRDQELDYVIMDEADQVNGTCELLMKSELSVSRLNKATDYLDDLPTGDRKLTASKNKLKASLSDLAESIEQVDFDRPFKALSGYLVEGIIDSVKSVNSGLSKLNDLMAESEKDLPLETTSALVDLAEITDRMARFSKFSGYGISQTKRHNLSLQVRGFASAWIAQKLFDSVSGLVCVSATLQDVTKDKGFEGIKTLFDIEQNCSERVYAPSHFGKMDFQCFSDAMPKPFLKGRAGTDYVHNPAWIDAVVMRANQAAETGAGVLVITPSHDEAMALLKHVDASEWLSNSYGVGIKAVVQKMKEAGGVLVSPSLWAGFSERRNDGSQLFDTLIVTRMPIAPRSDAEIHHLASWAERNEISTSTEALHYSLKRKEALNKFRQGLGRPIRHPDDQATVVFCDAKMTPEGQYGSGIMSLIPERFIAKYLAYTPIHPIHQSGTKEESIPWHMF